MAYCVVWGRLERVNPPNGEPMSEAWDEGAWQAFSGELDAWERAGRRASLWWRDDDAGRPDSNLDRLLRMEAEIGLPLGLAVVPAWLTPEVASAIRDAPEDVVVLQHGFSHTNHETEIPPGERKVRPAECGAARPARFTLDEMVEGAHRLRAAFASRSLPVFVPPWNRIAADVLAGLPGAGYRTVSSFRSRPAAEGAPGLLQVNCHVDPILWRHGKRFAGAAGTLEGLRAHLAARRNEQVDAAEPTGLLTHHRDMEESCWDFLAELLARLQRHPAVVFPPLPVLLLDTRAPS
jgi:hypothetical protein